MRPPLTAGQCRAGAAERCGDDPSSGSRVNVQDRTTCPYIHYSCSMHQVSRGPRIPGHLQSDLLTQMRLAPCRTRTSFPGLALDANWPSRRMGRYPDGCRRPLSVDILQPPSRSRAYHLRYLQTILGPYRSAHQLVELATQSTTPQTSFTNLRRYIETTLGSSPSRNRVYPHPALLLHQHSLWSTTLVRSIDVSDLINLK